MSHNAYLDQYRKGAVAGTTPLQLIIMLYDGALRFNSAAKVAIQQENLFEKNDKLTKSQRIITELMSCLDMEKGGEIAQNLMALYSYVYDQLVQANLNDDIECVDRASQVLNDLKSSWVQLDNMQKGQAPPHDKAA